jgi:hypothetical protein
VAKLAAHLLATATLWVQIQTFIKNTKWSTKAEEWPTTVVRQKILQKNKIKLEHNKFLLERERVIGGWGMLIL